MTVAARDLARLSALLDEAMPLTRAQREAWLAALPPADASFAGALRDVLDTDDGDEAALATLPRLAADETIARAGESVGPYRLVRELARGGMGSVWVAERSDGALRRRVALKLPRLAWGAGLARRMARERDIGARLEHPHIARLYDAGVDARGRPYLAFELIDGVRIDEWCLKQGLSARERLKLFLQVAEAVAYAHARLVVHRDLKPSNVLVSADGQVHLLDFGIAKLLQDNAEDTGLTRELGQALTPDYASPEQLRGEPVTVGSDVYSLGVLLHELLAGRRPHEAGPVPVKPLRGDVGAILAQALQRAPEARYATLEAMADDVRRYLAGEPVNARPATMGYRLRRFAGRHRTGVAALATVSLAAVAATIVIGVQTGRATTQAREAEVAKRFAIEAFRASVQDDDGDDPAAPSSFERLLERNAQLIGRAGSPRLQARLYGIEADILLDAQSFELAARNARQEIALLDQLDAPPAERVAPRLRLARALLGGNALAQSQAEAQGALDFARAAQDPLLDARARLQLGEALVAQGQLDAAEAQLRQVDAELPEGDPAAPPLVARALALRAAILDARADDDGAERLLRRAAAAAEATGGAPSRLAIDLQLELARHLVLRGQDEAARALLVPALVAARAGGGGSADAALIQAEMGALALYAGTGREDPGPTLDEVEREHDAILAPGARASSLQRAWADVYAAEAALARGNPARAQVLAARVEPLLLPVVREGRARLLLLEVLARSALFSGRAPAEPAIAAWLDLARRRFPGEAWRARLASAQQLALQARWDEADAVFARLADPASAPGLAGPAAARARGRIAAERLRAALDHGDAATALALAGDPSSAADATGRAEALCRAGRVPEARELLAAQARAGVAWRYAYSPELAREQAVRGLCALAGGDAKAAAAFERSASETFAGQPDVNPALGRPLERLATALARRGGG